MREKEFALLDSEKVEELEKELSIIRQKEITFTNEPIVTSISSISFPVFNFQKQLIGVVLCSVNQQITKKEEESLSEYIIEMSRNISNSLGYQQIRLRKNSEFINRG